MGLLQGWLEQAFDQQQKSNPLLEEAKDKSKATSLSYFPHSSNNKQRMYPRKCEGLLSNFQDPCWIHWIGQQRLGETPLHLHDYLHQGCKGKALKHLGWTSHGVASWFMIAWLERSNHFRINAFKQIGVVETVLWFLPKNNCSWFAPEWWRQTK